MFKRIEIKLAGPICLCNKQNLGWSLPVNDGLIIRCKTCETQLKVPNSLFVAAFILEKPYPDKPESKAINAKKLDESGVVIQFPTNIRNTDEDCSDDE